MAAKIPMVGKKFGHLLVLAEAGTRHYGSGLQGLVRVRCDCGREYVALAHHVRSGRITRCLRCANRAKAIASSVRLPNGRTVAQVAHETGVKLGTVYRRYLRGWPLDKLGTPLRTDRKAMGFGGSIDLPERRRTVYAEAGGSR